jgi:formylglycine-generating enzyme required for sulfatase activity/serine/threonine protein kinase
VPTHGNALPSDYQLEEYRLISVLGEGGFGITYRAEDGNLDCPVAIKEYLPIQLARRLEDGSVVSLSESHSSYFGDWKRRFLDEARTLARFRHRSIVRVLRFFEANGTAYLVMELEQGITLDQHFRHLIRQPTQEELDAIVGPVLDGLETVHEAGYLHRDIKPHNIILRDDGSPVLIDFGAARMEVDGRTRTLTSIYSPGYAAPEQYAEHGRLGPWTDLYAMGAVLYRAISGAKPMDSLSRMMQAEDPLPSAMQAALGDYRTEFLAGIDAALRLKPEDRPQSVAEWRRWLSVPRRTAPEAAIPVVAAPDLMATVLAPALEWAGPTDTPPAPPSEPALAPAPPQPAAPSQPEPAIEPEPAPEAAPENAPEDTPEGVNAWSRVKWVAVAAVLVLVGTLAGGLWLNRSTPTPTAAPPVAIAPAAPKAPVAAPADGAAAPSSVQATSPSAPQPAAVSASGDDTPGSVLRDCPDCPELVAIPAGAFAMGSPLADPLHRDRELPQHTVTIAKPFAIGRSAVTRQQFAAFARDTRLQTGGCSIYSRTGWRFDTKAGWHSPGFEQDDNHPAVCVSWTEAQAYVDWLSRKTGHTYRLPSEAEWEYAARAGSTEGRIWGDGSQCENANAADQTTHGVSPYLVAATCTDGFANTAPVGSLKPNAFGLHDMLGNAAQWTRDCWHPNYKGAPVDGSAWLDAKCNRRVVRGSAWSDAPDEVRTAVRYHQSPGDHEAGVGLRVVRELP